jgi:3-hydroxyacyl-[acyl-carrier-protein] dehydratase
MRTLREEIIGRADPPIRSRADGQGYELTFHFGDDFLGFQGHFPGHPILPAFVQLLLGECAVRMRREHPWSLRRIERSKFLRPIGPNEPVTVCWQEQPQEGLPPAKQSRWGPDESLRCSFTLRVGDEKAAVFALEFTVEDSQHA